MRRLKILTVILIILTAFNLQAQELIKAGEKAEYALILAGNDAGYVKFNITKGENNLLLFSGESKLIIPTATILFKSEAKLTSGIEFKELTVDADVSGMPNQSGKVICTFKEDTVHVSVEAAQNREQDFELKEDYLVLPANVMEFYYLGLKKFLSSNQEKLLITSFVPNGLTTMKVALTKKEAEKITLGEKEVDAVHITMGVGPQLLDFWVNPKTNGLVKMNIAAQQFEMVLK